MSERREPAIPASGERGPSGPAPQAPRAEGGSEATSELRDRLVLVLDVDDLDEARARARRLAPWFGIAKVGYELYAAAGPAAFGALQELGFRVFADLKLHDIPTTVERGARVLARSGAAFLNAHAAGGEAMMRGFVVGAREGARDAGLPPPVTLAVTVLTSDPEVSAFDARLVLARDAGCDGVVCSAHEVARARHAGLRTMVPGVRLAGSAVNDQARVATPEDALAAGADWLVVGRTVTAANDPVSAAARVRASAAAGLARLPGGSACLY